MVVPMCGPKRCILRLQSFLESAPRSSALTTGAFGITCGRAPGPVISCAASMPEAHSTQALADRTVRRITRRLMPFLFVLYFIAYLDRVNVSFAALEMTRELSMTHEAFGFGAGIFFLGYFLLEIPGAILVEASSARKWI